MEIGVAQVMAIIGSVASIACTIVVGALTFFLKRTLTTLEDADRKNAAEIEKVRSDLADLKSDLPLMYTLREDFIRVMNNVDSKLDELIKSSSTQHTKREG